MDTAGQTREINIGQDYLSCNVYTHGNQDCTNGGISGRKKDLYLIGEHVTLAEVELFCELYNKEVQDFLIVVKRNIMGKEYTHVEPLTDKVQGNWTMFGGNYLCTSDSRFKRLARVEHGLPLPIHDRVER